MTSLLGKAARISNFVEYGKVEDIDLSHAAVKTGEKEYEPDILVISAGCNRERQLEFVKTVLTRDRVALEVSSEEDEINALQVAAYLASKGKEVSYSGPLLKFLGNRISSALAEALSINGIRLSEKGEFQFPECEPSYPFEFYKTNDRLSINDRVYVTGDLVKGLPKVGELAMRTGTYVARAIGGFKEPFRPIFINVIKLPKRKAIYIKSDRPWGGTTEVFTVSTFRYLTKVFIERYYLLSNGKMGFLEKL